MSTLENMLSKRAHIIKPSATLKVNARVIELKSMGKKITSFAVGEPDFDTPDNIKTAAIESIKKGQTKYTSSEGIKDLKDAVKNKFAKENNLEYKNEEIIICVGGKGVLYNLFAATINDDDEVVIPSPYWVSYTEMVSLFGGKNVIIKTSHENEFKITAKQLESSITPKTKWIILNSPNNPTGSVYTKEDLEKLAEVFLANPHVGIITDDIYEHIIFGGLKFYNIANINHSLKNRTFIVNGVAKAYSMTGWRIGYGAGDSSIIKAMAIMQSQSVTCPTSISQYAAVEALSGNQDFIPINTREFEKKRDLAFGIISEFLDCYKPAGAFYLFPNIKKFFGKKTSSGNVIQNSIDFCTFLLEESQVATVPGVAFGDDDYFRLSYALSIEDIKEGCLKIKEFCSKIT